MIQPPENRKTGTRLGPGLPVDRKREREKRENSFLNNDIII